MREVLGGGEQRSTTGAKGRRKNGGGLPGATGWYSSAGCAGGKERRAEWFQGLLAREPKPPCPEEQRPAQPRIHHIRFPDPTWGGGRRKPGTAGG